MAAEIWILLMIIVGAVAAAAGFAYGRRGGLSQADLDAVQQQLDQARAEADAVQENVTGHFERSALLFGRLAHDYRDFLEHFSESAQELGISEIRARELLERADLPLLGDQRNVIDEQSAVKEAQAGQPDQPAPQPVQNEVDANVADAGDSLEPAPAEPPLMEDVVEPAAASSAAAVATMDAEQTAQEQPATTSRVVDVEIDDDTPDTSSPDTSSDERKQA